MVTEPDTLTEWRNPCAECGACCRQYIVPVYGYDVWRLSARQRLSPEQYVVVVPEKKERPEGFRLKAGGQVFTLALDKKGQFAIKKPCVFLMELPGETARCGVYADRPVVCQSYPMSLWSNVVALRRDVLCPPNSWPPPVIERPQWRRALGHLVFHLDIYGEVVARWNARVAAVPQADFVLPEYFSYLVNVYSQLDELNAQLGDAMMDTVLRTWPAFPRPALDDTTLTRYATRVPWLGYFARARQVIDSFYPYVPPQPPAMRATPDATASELPPEPPTPSSGG